MWNVLPDGQAGEYLTDRLTDEAVQYLRAHRDEPFFLYFPHYAVHTPLQADRELVATYEQVPEAARQGDPVYAAMVQSVDDSVGRVVATLKDLGLEENTVVIFASDNGGFWKATDNAPLRGHKGTYWEGGIRVPLIVKWPGLSVPGRVVSEPVISSDLYPTILAAAGLPMRPHQHLDGLNLTPLLARCRHASAPGAVLAFPPLQQSSGDHAPGRDPQGALEVDRNLRPGRRTATLQSGQ